MTEGEYRVGRDFNPSGDADVISVKVLAARLIDTILEIRETVAKHFDNGLEWDANDEVAAEKCELLDRAAREVENAAMWAVKAITKRAKPVAIRDPGNGEHANDTAGW